MLDNFREFRALGSSLYKYIFFILTAAIISFLPYKITIKKLHSGVFWKLQVFKTQPRKRALIFLLFPVIFLGISVSTAVASRNFYSPVLSLSLTLYRRVKSKVLVQNYKTTPRERERILQKFYKSELTGSETTIVPGENAKPNVIIIFSEGLSAEVIDKFNDLDLNLTPNLDKLYDESLVFTNYYNHTAATFRGLRGQLYSMYQHLGGYYSTNIGFGQVERTEMDKRLATGLISLVDILNEAGYGTYFLNPEPSNVRFSDYLENLHFGSVYSGEIHDRYLTDREVFDLLGNSINTIESPFFICVYNMGTHHGYDSPDAKYADGSDSVRNRFHNFDLQFGKFLANFMESEISNNTILIFTTDHASYNSPEYKKAFKSRQEYFVNTVPLFIYRKGIEHGIVDADGRNSLDLSPTVLDLLHINKHENYFLGSSLFLQNDNALERISAIGDDFYYTGSNTVTKSTLKYRKEISIIRDYYKISVNQAN
ncbi:MAG: LTA synthase family protein [Treponema sp.]|jgi:phosphoglycerol transferase MdoB-like AlkP superfamily enzyme|nr:LTA synthase family protein [Treponema sp.]